MWGAGWLNSIRIIVLSTSMILIPSYSWAQPIPQCQPYTKTVKRLKYEYKEMWIMRGFRANNKSYMELWASSNGSWTILNVSPPSGPKKPTMACLVMSGNGHEIQLLLEGDPV